MIAYFVMNECVKGVAGLAAPSLGRSTEYLHNRKSISMAHVKIQHRLVTVLRDESSNLLWVLFYPASQCLQGLQKHKKLINS